jgi:hypothetical protein
MSDSSMFGGQHPKSGPWETLKGSMLAPHLATPLMGTNENTTRGSGKVEPPMGWESSIKPSEGLTRGGGTMAH